MDKFIGGYLVGVFSFAIVFMICIPDYREFKSEERVKPSIELIIKDNKVDTLYVYKIKK